MKEAITFRDVLLVPKRSSIRSRKDVDTMGRFSRKLWQMMILSALLCAAFTTAGLGISYGPNLPVGATTILLTASVYALVSFGAEIKRRTWSQR